MATPPQFRGVPKCHPLGCRVTTVVQSRGGDENFLLLNGKKKLGCFPPPLNHVPTPTVPLTSNHKISPPPYNASCACLWDFETTLFRDQKGNHQRFLLLCFAVVFVITTELHTAPDQGTGQEDVSIPDEDPRREAVQRVHGRAHLLRVLPLRALRGVREVCQEAG